MIVSQQPQQRTYQVGSSNLNNYERREKFDSGTGNPEGRSLLTGPIPAAPGYEYVARPSSAPCGVPRVHGSDARAIHRRAVHGNGVPFLFEVQGTGYSTTHGPAGKPPIDHVNRNVRRIQHVMRESREKHAAKISNSPIPAKTLWRSKKYDHVQSKVKQRLEEEINRPPSRIQSARENFLRAHENTGPQYLRTESRNASRRASIGSSIDLTAPQIDDPSKTDYVKINSQWATAIPKVRRSTTAEIVSQVREKKEKDLKDYHEKQKGRVPYYIEKIKEKRAQDLHDAVVNAPDPDCPFGHVRIDNTQRLSTLQQLELSRAQLETKISHLPIRNDSLTLRRTKEEIEKKIIELDEAIKIFSKPKVFIKVQD